MSSICEDDFAGRALCRPPAKNISSQVDDGIDPGCHFCRLPFGSERSTRMGKKMPTSAKMVFSSSVVLDSFYLTPCILTILYTLYWVHDLATS